MIHLLFEIALYTFAAFGLFWWVVVLYFFLFHKENCNVSGVGHEDL